MTSVKPKEKNIYIIWNDGMKKNPKKPTLRAVFLSCQVLLKMTVPAQNLRISLSLFITPVMWQLSG